MKDEYYFELRSSVQNFVKLFGLLETNATPCGYPLSVSQVYALQELESNQLSITELASKLELERSSVSRLVDDLVKGGFVNRDINAANRREVILYLSEKGNKSIQQVRQRSVDFFRSLVEEFSDEDKELILGGFNKLTLALSRYRRNQNDK
ncbi:MarR family transcriptional regulator [Paenibacillus aurantius]|uniref:MarR family transcriptional regulator n=1 Tax=Paenibacillus aurantius TaxID=2918900 RepID=A0AA96LIM7_9BACL|nr:MarR family transcriptional regulator [Paenibacillus aurantius]WNQ12182.1 MarR family transcriptional regulator [Paenibacillus aurantius]